MSTAPADDQATEKETSLGKGRGIAVGDFEFNKVSYTSSSASAVGSGAFHTYRAARKREQDRLDALQTERQNAEDEATHRAKLEQNRMKAEEKTKKNAAKRRKRKLRRQEARFLAATKVDATVGQDTAEDPSSPIKNDGSFLETMLKKQKKD